LEEVAGKGGLFFCVEEWGSGGVEEGGRVSGRLPLARGEAHGSMHKDLDLKSEI